MSENEKGMITISKEDFSRRVIVDNAFSELAALKMDHAEKEELSKRVMNMLLAYKTIEHDEVNPEANRVIAREISEILKMIVDKPISVQVSILYILHKPSTAIWEYVDDMDDDVDSSNETKEEQLSTN